MADIKLVAEDSEIAISYTLRLADDTLVDQTEPGEVFRFKLGQGEMLAGLEALLIGLEVGTKGTFYVPPEEGFGAADPANVHELPKSEFAESFEYKVGDVIGFDTPTGEQIPGQVVEIGQQTVTVDFNHPLAGQTFIFEAKIEAIYS
jgi:FKBP-type peptidyl-prolyl cis-trans isomerase SlpA